jgi:c-di-GMP-binding flagellar brake protein YcgR
MLRTYEGIERRSNKRFRMNCTVIYRVDDTVDARFSLQGQDLRAKMLDISQNGMAMVTDRDIPVATVLSMRFTVLKVDKELVKFSCPMEITGEVRSNITVTEHQHRLGICFTKMKKVSVS